MGKSGAKKMNFPKLSVIIPAFNEEKTISYVVQELKEVLTNIGVLFEILIINDGSTDFTKREAIKTGERIINLKKNQGKGSALKIGFKLSKGLNILTLDSDGSHRRKDIELIVKTYFAGNNHMVIGSRFMFNPITRFTSATHIVGNKIFKYLFFIVSGKHITDSQSGLRIFSRAILSHVKISSQGYEFESELTAKSVGLGFDVFEVPIKCKPRIYGSSNLNSIRDGLKNAKTLITSYFSARKELKLR